MKRLLARAKMNAVLLATLIAIHHALYHR
jgi:hypothetical protein